MIGVLVASHASMAQGMKEAAALFFGSDIPQFDAVGFAMGDDPDAFEKVIQEKVEQLDQGDGVLILVDLFGGTPSHKTSTLINEHIRVVTGMNLPILIEVLSNRAEEENLNLESIMEIGKAGIQEWNPTRMQEEESLFS